MRVPSGIVLLVLAQGLAGCGSHAPVSPTAPTTTTPTTTSPTTTRVAISGNVMLTTIGETTQLTATATLSDNTTKDVTTDATWSRGDARVATVSPSGLVTVVGFGATWISATYQSRGASMTVTATLPGTFVIAGRVREPGAGGIANVPVIDTITGRSATTDSDGYFSLAGLPRLQAQLKAEKEGYEPAEVETTQTNVDLPLQRVIRLTAGSETAKPETLAPNGVSYTVDGKSCNPCRLIRVVVPRAGILDVRVTWTVTASKLTLFAEGQVVAGAVGALAANLFIAAPREVLIYLGAEPPSVVSDHTPFMLETSMR
jgi:hypothetical protein